VIHQRLPRLALGRLEELEEQPGVERMGGIVVRCAVAFELSETGGHAGDDMCLEDLLLMDIGGGVDGGHLAAHRFRKAAKETSEEVTYSSVVAIATCNFLDSIANEAGVVTLHEWLPQQRKPFCRDHGVHHRRALEDLKLVSAPNDPLVEQPATASYEEWLEIVIKFEFVGLQNNVILKSCS
jgi:hypothetical protein